MVVRHEWGVLSFKCLALTPHPPWFQVCSPNTAHKVKTGLMRRGALGGTCVEHCEQLGS